MKSKNKCKHEFKKLRNSRQTTFCGNGEDAIVQCKKCLKVFSIDLYNSFKEIKTQ
jgi:hypothetical protein